MLPNHLNHFTDTHYKGLPVLEGWTMIREYLESAHGTILQSLRGYPRLYAVRVDLRFPQSYWPLEGQALGNDFICRFRRSLKAKIDSSQQYSERMGYRVRKSGLRFVWCREYDQYGSKPHFHVLILLNRDAFNALGRFDSVRENLMGRITEAWASALGMDPLGCWGLAYIPENAEYRVDGRNGEGLAELFERASYLCKAESKSFIDGFHPFGSSRD